MNREVTLAIFRVRQDLGLPDENEEEKYYIQGSKIQQDVLNTLRTTTTAIEQLSRWYLDTRRNNHPLSIPFMVSSILTINVVDHLLNAALQVRSSDIPKFRFYSDFAFGINGPLTAIRTAEGYLEGDQSIDEEIQTFLNEQERTFDSNEPVSETAEKFLDLKTMSQRNSNLLREDPTGFLLVDEIAKETYRLGLALEGRICPIYLVLGAQTGQQMYKVLYRRFNNYLH